MDALTAPLMVGDIIECIAHDPNSNTQMPLGSKGIITWVCPDPSGAYYGGAMVKFTALTSHNTEFEWTLLRPRNCLRILSRKMDIPFDQIEEVEARIQEMNEV